jgi:PIN domain nuclease of toxin-antitoxin system
MIIELDTKLLDIGDLTMNQLVFLSMVLDKNQTTKNQDVHRLVSLISDDEISYLVQQGLITMIENGEFITYDATQKLKDFITPDKDYFDVFYERYPVYVLRPDGSKAYLRANVNKCRHLFYTTCGASQSMMEHLINCLDFEISKKMKEGKISYMKTMWRWLVDHQWEESEEEMNDTKQFVSAYGTDII